MAEQLKITYANMGSIDQAVLNEKFNEALAKIESLRGKNFPLLIGGKRVEASENFPVLSPMDTREPLFYFQQAGRKESKQAVEAAKAAFPAWRAWSWQDRCELIDRVADMISASQFELAAAMVLEMGKNRLEALGDVEETADLLR
jgi:1-pyrroline-5-carboxylate dehydrogenase